MSGASKLTVSLAWCSTTAEMRQDLDSTRDHQKEKLTIIVIGIPVVKRHERE